MTLEALNKRIKTTTDLRDIVSTMKMLSSVSIGPYEKALKSLDEYGLTVRSAFAGLMQDDRFQYPFRREMPSGGKTLSILVGTDNGLVGRFNRDVVSFARQDLREQKALSDAQFICIGKRVHLLAESAKLQVAAGYAIMNSLKEIATITDIVLLKINTLIQQEKFDRVWVYFTYKKSGESQKISRVQLMPLPATDMKKLKQEKWNGRTLPLTTADHLTLLKSLMNEYLTVVLGGALTASLAAEHYTRMVNMQQAEKNIDESLENMNLTYQQLRQTGITDELIDIVSGAESLKKKEKKNR